MELTFSPKHLQKVDTHEAPAPVPVIVICGATASGKTDLGLQLAQVLDIEIISADSRQIYQHLNIGTAKPTQQELSQVKHHFIDCLSPDATYNAGQFGNDAEQAAIEIHNRGKVPVVVGGSGLYIKSMCEGLFEDKNENVAIRASLEAELQDKGIDVMYNKLKEVDIELYELYSDKNPRRVLRALEHFYANNTKLSEAWRATKKKRHILPKYFCIDYSRAELYDRINKRVEIMWESGLPKETEAVLNLGYSKTLNSLNTVGYKETIGYLQGDITQDMAIEEIKKNTRHYAKRQLTWFNRVSCTLVNSHEPTPAQILLAFALEANLSFKANTKSISAESC